MKKSAKCCEYCGDKLIRLGVYSGTYTDLSCQNDYCTSYGEEQSQDILDREEMFAEYGNLHYQEEQDDDY